MNQFVDLWSRVQQVQLTEQDDDIYVGVFRLVAGTLPVQCTSCNLWDLMPVLIGQTFGRQGGKQL
jgi:hypothetical protein